MLLLAKRVSHLISRIGILELAMTIAACAAIWCLVEAGDNVARDRANPEFMDFFSHWISLVESDGLDRLSDYSEFCLEPLQLCERFVIRHPKHLLE